MRLFANNYTCTVNVDIFAQGYFCAFSLLMHIFLHDQNYVHLGVSSIDPIIFCFNHIIFSHIGSTALNTGKYVLCKSFYVHITFQNLITVKEM